MPLNYIFSNICLIYKFVIILNFRQNIHVIKFINFSFQLTSKMIIMKLFTKRKQVISNMFFSINIICKPLSLKFEGHNCFFAV